MKPKKSSKSTEQDKDWQKKIEDRTKAEKVGLDHPQGKERFEKTIKRSLKKRGNSKT